MYTSLGKTSNSFKYIPRSSHVLREKSDEKVKHYRVARFRRAREIRLGKRSGGVAQSKTLVSASTKSPSYLGASTRAGPSTRWREGGRSEKEEKSEGTSGQVEPQR